MSEWVTRRRAEKADAGSLARIPSARTIARFMTNGRDKLSKSETVLIAAIEARLPQLVKAPEVNLRLPSNDPYQSRRGHDFMVERAAGSLVASLCSGVRRDEAAVRAAVTSPWSNGQTEGQVTKLKLVKRPMYGRGKIGLLQARLTGAR